MNDTHRTPESLLRRLARTCDRAARCILHIVQLKISLYPALPLLRMLFVESSPWSRPLGMPLGSRLSSEPRGESELISSPPLETARVQKGKRTPPYRFTPQAATYSCALSASVAIVATRQQQDMARTWLSQRCLNRQRRGRWYHACRHRERGQFRCQNSSRLRRYQWPSMLPLPAARAGAL
jgi:hypothetical protein